MSRNRTSLWCDPFDGVRPSFNGTAASCARRLACAHSRHHPSRSACSMTLRSERADTVEWSKHRHGRLGFAPESSDSLSRRTDPNDPRAFIDIFTDIDPLFGAATFGTITTADADALKLMGTGNNVPGEYLHDGWPDVEVELDEADAL